MTSEIKPPDKTALITGCSSGLGKAMADCFRQHGFRVAGMCRTRPETELDCWIEGDVTQPADRERAVKTVREEFGRLDILVNNAGRGVYATWDELTEEELRAVFELDFFAVCFMTRSFLPLLEESRGSVINISSAAGRLWVPCMGAYCAAKAAVAMFSNTLGIEEKRHGLHVLDVAPGQVNTGFSSRSLGKRKPPESPGSAHTSPEKMAESVFRAWKSRKKRITYPRGLAIALFFVRCVIPGWYERISLRIWNLRK